MRKLTGLGVTMLTGTIATVAWAQAPQVRISVSEVKDTRTTGQFFAGLEVKLTALGDIYYQADRQRVTVTTAVDDTGHDLRKEKENNEAKYESVKEYGGFGPSDSGKSTITLKLKNPTRRAMTIATLEGTLEVFNPKADPRAIVAIDRLPARATGDQIAHPSLKAGNVELAILNKAQYDAAQQQQLERAKKEAGEMAGALMGAFAEMFKGFGAMSENSIAIKLNDPHNRIVGFRFVDGSGKEIDRQGWMRSGDVTVYNFGAPLPADTTLEILLGTSRALTKIPFALKDIALP